MKIYVMNLKSLIKNTLILCTLFSFIILNYNNTQSVFHDDSAKTIPIYCVHTKEKVCALSFDAAWGAEDTDLLIEILDTYNVKATFFVVGNWVDKFPEQVNKLHNAGHDIMNHSDTHRYMTRLTTEDMLNEVNKCSKKIENITKKKVDLFRAPYGDYNSKIVKKLKENGYYTIQWDVDSLDWKDLSCDEITSRVINKVKNGSIVLFHNAAKNTPDALPKIIENLKNKGFKFIKISDMIYRKDYYVDNTGKQMKNN